MMHFHNTVTHITTKYSHLSLCFSGRTIYLNIILAPSIPRGKNRGEQSLCVLRRADEVVIEISNFPWIFNLTLCSCNTKMNVAHILRDSDNLNELSGIQYVLIEKKNKWFSSTQHSLSPLNFIKLKIPQAKTPKAILLYTLKIIYQVPQWVQLDIGSAVSSVSS